MLKNRYAYQIYLFEWWASLFGIVGVCSVLAGALYVQFFQLEDPCPLCLLQRACFVNMGLAFLMNVIFEIRISHWALAMLSALAGRAVSLRQIALHVNDVIGFGSPILGLHLYTWAFLFFTLGLFGCAFVMLIHPEDVPELKEKRMFFKTFFSRLQ